MNRPNNKCKPLPWRQNPARGCRPEDKSLLFRLRQDLYERLNKDDDYDDGPWTDEEMELLAWETGKHAGWEDMDEYDRYPEKQ